MRLVGGADVAVQRIAVAASLLAVVGIGLVDAQAPHVVRLGTVYVLPVLAAQAWGPAWAGGATAVASVLADGVAAWAQGVRTPLVLAGLGVLRLAVYLICARVLAALQRDRRRLQYLASVDPGTGVLNRRGFTDHAEAEIRRSRRHGHPLSLLFVDLDGFKAVNDRYGHAAGDAVLERVAGLLTASVRAHDVVGRLGGDEFAVLLPETDDDGAAAVVDHLRERLARLAPPAPVPPHPALSASIGRASGAAGDVPDLADLLRLADADMYRRKPEPA